MATRTFISMSLMLVSSLVVTRSATAAILHVPSQYPTIGAALAAAQNGDRIFVADGVYTGPGNRNLDFAGKHLRVRSEHGPDNCTIDCQAQGRAFHFHSGEPPAVSLEGFTIQNGAADGHGGGILCESSSPTIRHCVFRWNMVQTVYHEGGGGMSVLDGSDPHLVECMFEENVATPVPETGGGAVEVANGCHPSFVRCTFARNTARDGGAVVTAIGSHAHFRDCLFTENAAEHHGGGLVCFFDSQVLLENSQFIRNTAGADGGGAAIAESQGTVRRCAFYGNRACLAQAGGGGGMSVTESAQVIVDDSVLSGNSGTGDGGAIGVGGDSDLIVSNSTLTSNDAPFGYGHAIGGAICAFGSRITVVNSVVHGNTATDGPAFGLVVPPDGFPPAAPMVVTVSASLVQGGASAVFIQSSDPNDPNFVVNWSADNFDSNPMFVRAPNAGPDGVPGTTDDDYGDLHLLPGSPCIDAGDPGYVPAPGETDIDGNPRVLDGDGNGSALIDIGADEFILPPCLGDVDGDADVDQSDFNALVAHWGTPAGASYVDGDVDLRDFAFLARSFGATCP